MKFVYMKHRHPVRNRLRGYLVVVSLLIGACLVAVLIGRYYMAIPLIAKKPPGLAPAKYRLKAVKDFQFSQSDSLKEWEEKIFKNKVIYRIEEKSPFSYVKAFSDNASSALYYKIKLDAKKRHPVLSWKWGVKKFPVKKFPEDLHIRDEDDYAARVYVIFPATFFTNSKALVYVWAETLPVGTVSSSPYSKNIKLIVARSGMDTDGGFKAEERDLVADYLMVFGRPPEYDVGAVAFMTNTDHTASNAEAMYDDIMLSYKEEPGNEGKGGGTP